MNTESFSPLVRRRNCARCGAKTKHGYGARGGDVGPFVECTSCGWFYQEQDEKR